MAVFRWRHRRRDHSLGGSLVLPLRHQLSRTQGDDGRARRRGRPHDDVPVDAALCARTREAFGLVPQPAVVLLEG